MTDCPRADIRDLLPDWVHGSLDDAAAARVAAHLASCTACAREAELLGALRTVIDRPPAIDVGRIAAAVAAHTVGAESRKAPPRTRARAPVYAAITVAASLLFGVLVIERADEPTERLPPVAATEADTVVGDSQPTVPDDGGPDVPAPAMRLADAGLSVGGALDDLPDEALETLLQRLDAIEALPQTSPAPAITTDFEVQ